MTAVIHNTLNTVTDNEQTAKRMIEFLKKNKFGRATFLPLTQIRSHGGIAQPQALKEAGVIGLADTLVMVEDKYLELAGSLLGRTLVVDHIDHGLAIARKYRQSDSLLQSCSLPDRHSSSLYFGGHMLSVVNL